MDAGGVKSRDSGVFQVRDRLAAVDETVEKLCCTWGER
jgi:hypothetical protein